MSEAGAPLPPHVVTFLRSHVTSLLQLETLLLVFEAGRRPVTADNVAAQMYLGPSVVRQWLEEFTLSGFAQSTADGYVLADSRDVFDLLTDVADAYLRRRIALGRVIFASASHRDSRMKLSDAFLLRKEP